MNTGQRSRRAFLRALPPTTVTALIAVLIAGAQVVQGDVSIGAVSAIAAGLTLVVCVSYFSLSVTGYRVKADTVDVPARYAWPLVGAVTVAVMATALYLASRFAR